ncbi:MAG: PilZ domain-containing protein [Candidatus Solibacter sp.]
MDQRRTRRFQLQLPLSITRSGAERITFTGLTRNISSSGVFFTAEKEPDLGSPIEYVIALSHEGPQSVSLRCIGKVLRSTPMPSHDESATFHVAATLERYEFIRVARSISASL